MIIKLFLIIIFIVIILYIILKCETIENMDNFTKLIDLYPSTPFDSDKKFNLEDLPKCKLPMVLGFTSNYNNIINNGKEVLQEIINPEEQSGMIGKKRHKLLQVSWKKSNMRWKNKDIELELNLIIFNMDDNNITNIIIPLLLTTNTIEHFTNINNSNNLKILTQNMTMIPQYKCCSPIVSEPVLIDLCSTAKKLIEEEYFYFTTNTNNSLLLITKPSPYNKNIGQNFINSMEKNI